jgi:hypothetical protein
MSVELPSQLLHPAIMMPEEQRVISTMKTQLTPLQRVTAAPATILASNPTAPCSLRTKPCSHQQHTRNNTPGALLQINRAHRIPPLPLFTEIDEPATPAPTAPPHRSNHLNSAPLPHFHTVKNIGKEAINSLIISNVSTKKSAFTPLLLCP